MNAEKEAKAGVTEADVVAHLREGHKGACLVCGTNPRMGSWTDYNGQVYCLICGCTYQILGDHLSDEFKERHGLTSGDIAREYCDCFELVPLLREHWEATKQPAPVGTWLGGGPYRREVYDNFNRWLSDNADALSERYPDTFHWDRIIAKRDAALAEGRPQ